MRKLGLFAIATAVTLAPVYGFAQTAVVTVPSEVDTYVMKENLPSVRVEREVVVGSTLPDSVELRTVPQHDTYSYAVVNNKRVVVEAKTRKVVKVLQ